YTEEYFKDDNLINILNKYEIKKSKTLFIYGGNIGLPQGPHNIIKVAKEFKNINNTELIIIGKGTHFNEVKEIANGISNVKVISELPKYEYDLLLKYADVGFVFLDERFTIPNYPSRATSY